MERIVRLAPLALLLCGCGLADYEAKVQQAQVAADRADAEAANLDEPLMVPRARLSAWLGGDGEPLDVYLRPPKGIRATPEEKLYADFIARYPRKAATTPLLEVFLAVGGERTERAAFELRTLQLFQAPRPDPAALQPHEVRPPNRDPMTFDRVEFTIDRDSSYSFNVLQGPTPVLIVYRAEKDRLAEVAPAIELSLESLAIGPAAAEARQAPPGRRGR